MLNKKEILVLCLIICLTFQNIWFFGYTFPNEYATKDLWKGNKDPFYYLHPRFDYLNGLWLIGGLLFICIFAIIFDFPSYSDVYKCLKKDFKNKIKEGKKSLQKF